MLVESNTMLSRIVAAFPLCNV